LSQSDHFELLGVARGFEVDPQDLESRWKDRVAAVHPDRFAGASDAQKRVAMQWSSRINEAYRVLKDPLKRAQYLCELAGFPTENQPQVALDPVFLMQQMQWRETLEEVTDQGDASALLELEKEMVADRDSRKAQVAQLIGQGRWDDVVKGLHEWMFIEKFLQELASAQRILSRRS
jgi:molecular chaperone HscB